MYKTKQTNNNNKKTQKKLSKIYFYDCVVTFVYYDISLKY